MVQATLVLSLVALELEFVYRSGDYADEQTEDDDLKEISHHCWVDEAHFCTSFKSTSFILLI